MNYLLYCFALAVLDVWKMSNLTTSNRSFLESSDKSALSKKDYPSSDSSPGLKSCLPLDFLSDLRHILQEVADSNIDSIVERQRKFVQDAILFMGERDEDGNDSGNPGLLQALRYEWTGVPDRTLSHMQREQKPGLAGDLENLCQLVEQRIRICRSRILTLNGKAKRAQLMKDDPKWVVAPQIVFLKCSLWFAISTPLLRANVIAAAYCVVFKMQNADQSLDIARISMHPRILCASSFGASWICILTSLMRIGVFLPRAASHQLHRNKSMLFIFAMLLIRVPSRLIFFKNLLTIIIHRQNNWFSCLFFLAFLWTLDMFDFLPVCLISFVVFILIGLILSCGRVNLPYILARLKIIEPNDIHHGVTHYRYLSHIALPEQFTHSLFSPLSRHWPGCVDISCVLFHSGSHRIVPPSPNMLSYCGCSVLCIWFGCRPPGF